MIKIMVCLQFYNPVLYYNMKLLGDYWFFVYYLTKLLTDFLFTNLKLQLFRDEYMIYSDFS